MSKRLWIISGVAALFFIGLMAWFFRPEVSSLLATKVQLKIGWSGPEKSGQGQTISAYEQELKKRGAKAQLTLFSGDRLGENSSVLEQIRLGQPYLTFLTMNSGAQYSKKAKVLSLPVLFKNNSEITAFMESDSGEALKEELAAKGFQVLGWISMPVDSLWIASGKKFPEDVKSLNVGMEGQGYDELFWKNYGANLRSLPQGLWESERMGGTLQGLVASSEWMSQKGVFWKLPKRISIGGVKPVFLVMNQELFLSLPAETQKTLMESTAVWSDWGSEKIEEINFNQMASQTNIVTTMVPGSEYPALMARPIQELDAEQKEYLNAIRKAVGGKLFYEEFTPKPEEPLKPEDKDQKKDGETPKATETKPSIEVKKQ